jgi:hypothetical protein
MLSLVYLSDAVRPMSSSDLDQILLDARAFNADAGVTGLLVYAQQRFLQVIEGPAPAVEGAFAQAAGSSKHRLLRPTRASISQRRFPDWSMGFTEAAPSAVAEGILAPLISAGLLDHQEAASLLLARFQQLAGHDAVVRDAIISR